MLPLCLHIEQIPCQSCFIVNKTRNYLYTRMVARTMKARLILPQATNSIHYKDATG